MWVWHCLQMYGFSAKQLWWPRMGQPLHGNRQVMTLLSWTWHSCIILYLATVNLAPDCLRCAFRQDGLWMPALYLLYQLLLNVCQRQNAAIQLEQASKQPLWKQCLWHVGKRIKWFQELQCNKLLARSSQSGSLVFPGSGNIISLLIQVQVRECYSSLSTHFLYVGHWHVSIIIIAFIHYLLYARHNIFWVLLILQQMY